MSRPISRRLLDYYENSGSSPVFREDSPQDLARNINNQQEELRLRGVDSSPKKKRKGILGKILGAGADVVNRTLDVASRPLYAAANEVKNITSRDYLSNGLQAGLDLLHGDISGAAKELSGGLKDVGEHAYKGFSGKEKTSYADVLNDNFGFDSNSGLDRAVRGIGGFALDVAGDPSTYLTGGTVALSRATGEDLGKGALKQGAEALAKKEAGVAAKKVIKEGSVAATETTKRKILDDIVARGLDGTSEPLTADGIKNLEKSLTQDAAYEAGLAAKDKALGDVKRVFQYKLGQQPVFQSEKLYNIGSKINQAFQSTQVGSGLAKTFSTSYKLPGRLKQFKQEAFGYSHAQMEKTAKNIKSAFKDISQEDKRLISDAIEKGHDLSGTLGTAGKDLGPYQKEAMDYLDSIKDVELSQGILDEKNLLDNYLYHYYKTNDREAVSEFKNIRRKVQNPNTAVKGTKINKAQGSLFDIAEYSPKSTIKTLKEAEAAGLKPIREIDDILLLRYGKSYNQQGASSLADAAAREFGIEGLDKETAKRLDLVPSSSRYLKGREVHFPKEVENALSSLEKARFNPQEVNGLLRTYDKQLANLKFMQTAINPGHHIRNAVGDMFLNALDGVTNPIRYDQAFRALADDTGKKLIRVGDGAINTEELRRLYNLKGAKAGYTRVEIGARRFGISEKIREGAEVREDFTRMAHFIDALKDEGKAIKGVGTTKGLTDLEEAASKAAARVRKFNFDYGDLTDAEKKVFRRVTPFYTWMRKNIPLQLEAMALSPGRFAIQPKTLTAVNQLLGNKQGDYSKIGGLDSVPQWIRDMAGIRIIGEGQGRNGVYFDPSQLLPGLQPIQDVLGPAAALASGDVQGATSSLSKTILNQTSLPIQAAIESATGKDLFTGQDNKDSVGQMFQNSIPFGRIASDVRNGDFSKYDAINYLTGSSFREVTPGMQKGELRRQQDIIEAKLRASADRALDPNRPASLDRYRLTSEYATYKRQKAEKDQRDRIKAILRGYNGTSVTSGNNYQYNL